MTRSPGASSGLRVAETAGGSGFAEDLPERASLANGGLEGGTPGAAAGWNKPARLWKEQPPEGVRNVERGTYRDVGTPGSWTSRALFAGGDRTLREPVATACGSGSCLRPYSEEEAEAQERRALCVKHGAGRKPGMP
jgi:hypothetical protein